MSRKAAVFSLRLKNKRGAKTQPRFAAFFDVYYGKRKLGATQEVPKRFKTTDQKKRFFVRVLKELEKQKELKREKALQVRQKKERARKRDIQKAKKELRDLQEQRDFEERAEELRLYDQIQEIIEQRKIAPGSKPEIIESQQRLIKLESPNLDLAVVEDPETLINATIDMVSIVPFTPKNPFYDKELIDKSITINRGGTIIDLTILNFTLKQEFWVPISMDNFKNAVVRSFDFFYAHMLEFFKAMRKVDKDYFLRIKYGREIAQDVFEQSAVALPRTRVADFDGMKNLYLRTMNSLHKNNSRKNYLAGDFSLFITGFTLESTTKD